MLPLLFSFPPNLEQHLPSFLFSFPSTPTRGEKKRSQATAVGRQRDRQLGDPEHRHLGALRPCSER